jgi:hypothetical protein
VEAPTLDPARLFELEIMHFFMKTNVAIDPNAIIDSCYCSILAQPVLWMVTTMRDEWSL